MYTTTSGTICDDISNNITITVDENPTVEINGVSEICEGQTTSLNVSGGTTYLWSTGSTNTSLINISLSGTYTVTVTNNSGCTSSSSKVVTVKNKPIVELSGSTKICTGSSTVIKAKGGQSYSWNNGTDTDSIVISNPGTYTVTVTNSSGCTNIASVLIEANPNPVATISGQTEICEGELSTLVASGGSKYLWNSGSTTSTINISNAGIYTVTISDQNGCIDIKSVTMILKSKPTGLITGDSVICKGQNAIFTASGGTSYLWSNGQTTSSIVLNGTTTYIVTVTGANGCKTTVSKSVQVNEPPVAKIKGTTKLCKGTEIMLTAEGGSEYIWNNNTTDNTIVVKNGGQVSLKVIDVNGCQDTTSVQIIEYQLPLAKINGVDSICQNSKTVFTATGGVSYIWSNGVSDAVMEATGNNTYSVTVTDANGCSASSSKKVTSLDKISTPYDWLLSQNPICVGDTIYVQVKGLANASYNWSSSSPFAGLQSTQSSNSMIVPTKEGKYIIKVLQKLEECNLNSQQSELEINVNPRPRLNLGQDTIICHQDGGLTLYVEEYPYIKWSNGSSSNEMLVTEKGYYSVLVEDENGCISTDVIQVKEFCCKVYHPNIINLNSWNGNNQFKVSHTGCVITSKLSIYDRWGNLVYRSNDGLAPWDGTFGGKPVETGVYTFIFTYTALDEDDKEFEEKVTGDITVIK